MMTAIEMFTESSNIRKYFNFAFIYKYECIYKKFYFKNNVLTSLFSIYTHWS